VTTINVTPGLESSAAPVAAEPGLSILRINFRELYERHLCRHSQFGNNVAHVLTMGGSYLAIFGLLAAILPGPWWVLWLVPLPWVILMAVNVPWPQLLVSVLVLAGILALLQALPPVPFWIWLLMIPLCHYLQNVSHKFWTIERDMTAYKKKYQKGPKLFCLLLVYELPILVNYLVFGRRDWAK
jgi:hypothetical protein